MQRLRAGERYLVIVTDLVMAGMDGIDLLRAVRELDAAVPVIILTGRPTLRSTIAAADVDALLADGAGYTPLGAAAERGHATLFGRAVGTTSTCR